MQACIDHELAILATGVGVLWATWGAPNQIGLWTFLALWGMRLSAKLNVFLGVLNLGEAFLPPHLTYLLSYMRRQRMNALMPVSLIGGSLLVAMLVRDVPMTPGLVFVVTMLVLAVLEHGMLVAPVPFETLWAWWLSTPFLKKRSKKLLIISAPACPNVRLNEQKSFWFFSSEKNRLRNLPHELRILFHPRAGHPAHPGQLPRIRQPAAPARRFFPASCTSAPAAATR